MTTPRRERRWSDLTFNIQLGATASITPVNLLAGLDAGRTKVTVVRILLDMLIYVDGMANSVDGANRLLLGIGVVSQDAQVAGQFPDPGVDSDRPRDGWLFKRAVTVANQQSSGTQEAFLFPEIHADVRAKRIVDRAELFMAATSFTSSGTGSTLRLAGMARCLVLL